MSGASVRPRVTVVVETITARFDCASGALADDLAGTLAAIAGQTYPANAIETLIILDADVPAADREELVRRHHGLRVLASEKSNYFDAKNAGARAATGDFVALLDGDCAPAPDWLDRLVEAFRPGVAAIAGKTRYTGRTWAERIFSIPDFAYVLDEGGGRASGFNINNVLFRREVLLAHPFDPRIVRNGGCYLLFHQLKAAGEEVLYTPHAQVSHGNDIAGFGFVRKHYDRGHDSVAIYRLDDREVLRGTSLFDRFGPLALIGFTGRRILLDWQRLGRHRRQIGIRTAAVPFYCAVAALLRSIELSGAIAATLAPGRRKGVHRGLSHPA